MIKYHRTIISDHSFHKILTFFYFIKKFVEVSVGFEEPALYVTILFLKHNQSNRYFFCRSCYCNSDFSNMMNKTLILYRYYISHLIWKFHLNFVLALISNYVYSFSFYTYDHTNITLVSM